eukprot:scaffold24900_cov132-Isochrysis_galbana.AAC.4
MGTRSAGVLWNSCERRGRAGDKGASNGDFRPSAARHREPRGCSNCFPCRSLDTTPPSAGPHPSQPRPMCPMRLNSPAACRG